MMIAIPGKVLSEAECKAESGSVIIRVGSDGYVEVVLDGLVVSMCGGADLHEGNPIWDEILKLSGALAERGGVMINGGGQSGSMVATTRAFPEHTLGVICPPMTGNPYGPKAVVEDRLTRVGVLTKIPVIIVFEGGVGTIEEWGRALREIKNSYADNTGAAAKVFLHNYWKKTFDAMWAARAIPKRIMDHVQFFVTADEVMRQLSP